MQFRAGRSNWRCSRQMDNQTMVADWGVRCFHAERTRELVARRLGGPFFTEPALSWRDAAEGRE